MLLIPFSLSFTFVSVLLPCSSVEKPHITAAGTTGRTMAAHSSPALGPALQREVARVCCSRRGSPQDGEALPEMGFWHSALSPPTPSSLSKWVHPGELPLAEWQTSKSLLSLLISLLVKTQPLAQTISIKLCFLACVWTAVFLSACGVENGSKRRQNHLLLGI